MVGAAPVKAAKEKKKAAKQAARTWVTLVDYVLKNGGEDSLKAPATRTLGYDSDEIFAKSMGIDNDKSKNGLDHSIYIITDKSDSGISNPKEIVLTTTRVKERDSQKEIDGFEIRMTLAGVPIRGLRATGIVGHVIQQALPPDSKELISVHRNESSFYLKDIDLAKLTK